MRPEERKQVIEALMVTAQIMGTELSELAARVMVRDLEQYPAPAILEALRRVRREVSGRLTLAAIIERIPDGRPTPEEAWAMCPKDESVTVVWTDEMAAAYGAAAPLLKAGDMVQARLAFLERYREELRRARDEGRPVRWWPSLGHDPAGRAAVLEEAVRMGRLPAEHALRICPELEDRLALPGCESKQAINEENVRKVNDMLSRAVKRMKGGDYGEASN